jgi:hypothetical protein
MKSIVLQRIKTKPIPRFIEGKIIIKIHKANKSTYFLKAFLITLKGKPLIDYGEFVIRNGFNFELEGLIFRDRILYK